MPASFVEVFRLAAGTDRIHRFWQTSRHPVAVQSEAFHSEKRNYLHDNPRRKGLVLDATHWRWASARWHATGQVCDVPLTMVQW